MYVLLVSANFLFDLSSLSAENWTDHCVVLHFRLLRHLALEALRKQILTFRLAFGLLLLVRQFLSLEIRFLLHAARSFALLSLDFFHFRIWAIRLIHRFLAASSLFKNLRTVESVSLGKVIVACVLLLFGSKLWKLWVIHFLIADVLVNVFNVKQVFKLHLFSNFLLSFLVLPVQLDLMTRLDHGMLLNYRLFRLRWSREVEEKGWLLNFEIIRPNLELSWFLGNRSVKIIKFIDRIHAMAHVLLLKEKVTARWWLFRNLASLSLGSRRMRSSYDFIREKRFLDWTFIRVDEDRFFKNGLFHWLSLLFWWPFLLLCRLLIIEDVCLCSFFF